MRFSAYLTKIASSLPWTACEHVSAEHSQILVCSERTEDICLEQNLIFDVGRRLGSTGSGWRYASLTCVSTARA